LSGNSVLAVPLPFFTALLACAVAVRLWTGAAGSRTGRAFFTALLGLFAIEAVLVGLRFGYGVQALIGVQRVLPFLVGPLMYLGFRALTGEGRALTRAAVAHLGAALVVISACLAGPPFAQLPDFFIAASYCVYLALLVRLWRRGPDAFSDAPLGGTALLRAWLVRSILLLAFILVLDTLIALDFALGAGRRVSVLIALGSLFLIVGFVAAALIWPLAAPGAEGTGAAEADAPAPEPEARELAERAAALLTETRLYRDPGLTLSRLARRLGVTVRALSGAINLVHGVNVSQFVNGPPHSRRCRAARSFLRQRKRHRDGCRIPLALEFLSRVPPRPRFKPGRIPAAGTLSKGRRLTVSRLGAG